MPSRRWASGGSGYDGLFGDSFFSDCWDTMDSTSNFRKNKRIIHEDVAADVPEELVKPWFRKTNLSRISDDDIYQVMLEVSNFTPSELSVKLLNNKTVVVVGKHGERADIDGFVSREFTRKYNLPESVVPSSVECYMSKDGVLVIRGHAPRQSRLGSQNGRLSSMEHGHDHLIPVFTQGYHTRHSSDNSSSSVRHHNERIIPITQDNGTTKSNMSNLSATRNETAKEEFQEVFSGRSSRSSDRDRIIKSPQPNEFLENGTNGRRSRTVSFNDDDTIASNSPIIEEPASISSNYQTPEPQPSTSKKISQFSRQNNVEESSSQFRSSSRMSEERSQTPTINGLNGNRKAGNHIETVTIDLDDKERDIFQDHHHDLLRSRSPLDNFDKFHKEIIERHRHLSRESLERMQMDSDKLLRTARTRSPLFQHRIDDDLDVFDSPLKNFDRPLKWESNIPPKSREEQYEKKIEKGYDKNGNWTQTLEENMFSKQYSSNFDSDNNKFRNLVNQRKHDKSMEHPINISSAA